MSSPMLVVVLAGALLAVGIYMLLQRNLLRALLGLAVLSNGINLLLLSMGGLGSSAPPLVAAGGLEPAATTANPLPQALVLTAIVISFGLLSFALVLARQVHRRLDSVDGDDMSPGQAAAAAGETTGTEGTAPDHGIR